MHVHEGMRQCIHMKAFDVQEGQGGRLLLKPQKGFSGLNLSCSIIFEMDLSDNFDVVCHCADGGQG